MAEQQERHILKVVSREVTFPPLPSPTTIYIPSNKGNYRRQPTWIVIQVSHTVSRLNVEYNVSCRSRRLFVKCHSVRLCSYRRVLHTRTVRSQPDSHSQTQTDTLRTYRVWSSSKRRNREEEEDEGRRKEESWTEGEWEGSRRSCLFALNCLVTRLCWILTSCACCLDPSACSPVARGGGTTSHAWGRGQGAGGRGPGLTEGYKYHQSPVINRVTVRNLAELWRDTWKYPPQTQAPPTTLLHRPLWWWCWWY